MGHKHAEEARKADEALGDPTWRGPVIRSICALVALGLFGWAAWLVHDQPEGVDWVFAAMLSLVGLDAAISAWRRREPFVAKLPYIP